MGKKYLQQAAREGRVAVLPEWLTEGILDYVRFYLFEPESHGCDMVLRSAEARYDGKYRVSANFLDFVERRHPGVVKELNALCRQGKYDEEASARHSNALVSPSAGTCGSAGRAIAKADKVILHQ